MAKPKTTLSDLPAGHKFTPSNDDTSPVAALCLDVARATVRQAPGNGGLALSETVGEGLAEMLAQELGRKLAEVMPATIARSIGDDLLEGAEAIAAFVYGDPAEKRKVYHLAQHCRFPAFRLGATLCARKSVVTAWIAEQEAAGAAGKG